jgi:Domain of unknown function (DUF4232)
MRPTTLARARSLSLAAAAALALTLAAAGCTGRATTSTASAPTSPVPPAGTPAAAPATTTPANGPPTPAPTLVTAAPTTPAGPGRCRTADLTAGLHDLDPGAGQRYEVLVFTNRSTSSYRVYGYGGIQLLDAARHPLPTRQIRSRYAPPRLVTLRPGASAYSMLHWTVVPDDAEGLTWPCEPEPSYLLVTPPDETQPITVVWSAGSVCQHGSIGQTAYVAGTGPTY